MLQMQEKQLSCTLFYPFLPPALTLPGFSFLDSQA